MIQNLSAFISALGQEWSCKTSEVNSSRYSVDVPLRLDDGTFRFQMLYIDYHPEGDRACISLFTRIGIFSSSINISEILSETTTFCFYSSMGIVNENDRHGNPVNVLWMLSRPLLEHTTEDLLKKIIWEVALNADYFEKKYFGTDSY